MYFPRIKLVTQIKNLQLLKIYHVVKVKNKLTKLNKVYEIMRNGYEINPFTAKLSLKTYAPAFM